MVRARRPLAAPRLGQGVTHAPRERSLVLGQTTGRFFRSRSQWMGNRLRAHSDTPSFPFAVFAVGGNRLLRENRSCGEGNAMAGPLATTILARFNSLRRLRCRFGAIVGRRLPTRTTTEGPLPIGL